MKHTATIITTTLVMALALLVGACGDTTGSGGQGASAGNGSSANAANITFRTDPRGVEVWIDGSKAGSTPVVVAVEPGTHAIEFKRDGFEPVKDSLAVEAGKDLTVTSALAVTGDPEERVAHLLAALEIPEHENLEPKAHRGTTPPVMLYWPQRDVRKEGVSTYRIEIGAYDDDGFLVFKKGKDVLHREPFRATSLVMEGALPQSVMEALKRGTTITWGIDFENKRKKDVMATFKVKDGRALERKLKKLESRSVYKRAGDLERQIARIELKRNYRFYTEALTDAMSVLNTWPDTMIADKVIADSLQRLKLKDTALYTEIMKRLRGSGDPRARPGSSGLGPVARPLAGSLVAPKVRPSSGTAQRAKGGLGAGGMGVTPTGGDQKRKPGPIVDEGGSASGDSGERVQPGQPGTSGTPGSGTKRDHEALKDELAEVEKIREAIDAADKKAEDAQQALEDAVKAQEDARQAVSDAEDALETATQGGDDAAIKAADEALQAAREGAIEADKAHEAAREASEEAGKAARETREQHGGADEVEQREQRVRRRLEEANANGSQPGAGAPGSGTKRSHEELQDELAEVEKIRERIDEAEQRIADSQQALDDALKAQEDARQAVSDAEQALETATQGGDDAAIKAADEALQTARESAIEADKAHDEARQASEQAGKDGRAIRQEHGNPQEVKEKEQRLRRELSNRDGVGNDPLAVGGGQTPGAAMNEQRLRRSLKDAQARLEDAKQHVGTTASALDAAQTGYDDASKKLDLAEQSGDADAVTEAENHLMQASENLARAQMDAARAKAEVKKAEGAVQEAQDQLQGSAPGGNANR